MAAFQDDKEIFPSSCRPELVRPDRVRSPVGGVATSVIRVSPAPTYHYQVFIIEHTLVIQGYPYIWCQQFVIVCARATAENARIICNLMFLYACGTYTSVRGLIMFR